MSELVHDMSEFGGLTILLARIDKLNFICWGKYVNFAPPEKIVKSLLSEV